MKLSGHIVERWTGKVLKLGVWISGGLMVIGLLAASLQSTTMTLPKDNPTLGALLSRMISGSFDPVSTMFLGLVLLMFTPFLRVLTAVVGFAAEKNWRFVAVSVAVFVLLIGELVYSLYR
jgi:uncharacterized membrane protein